MKTSTLPPLDDALRSQYLTLLAEIDHLTEDISERCFKQMLQCRPGCAECCMQFSVLALEAAMVNERLGRMSALRRSPQDSHCTLLEDSRCLIYDIRPIICRTQGLPLAYRDDESGHISGHIEVSACYRNFPADFLFTEDHLVFMDQFNCRLATLNFQYCRSAGLDPLQRIPLADLTASAASSGQQVE